MTTATPAAPPLTVLSAVARHLAALPALAVLEDRISAGAAPDAWTVDEVDRYLETSTVAGPNPDLRGDGKVLAWAHLVQVDLWESEALEDPALAAAIIAATDDVHLDHLDGAAGWRLTLDTVERVNGFPDAGWARHRLTVRVRQPR